MRKIIFILLFSLMLPFCVLAQSDSYLDIPLHSSNHEICVPDVVSQSRFEYNAVGTRINSTDTATWKVENGRFIIGSSTHTSTTTTGNHNVIVQWDEPPFTLDNKIQQGKITVTVSGEKCEESICLLSVRGYVLSGVKMNGGTTYTDVINVPYNKTTPFDLETEYLKYPNSTVNNYYVNT